MNEQQDEGRIDPFDTPINAGGISEFARQEEEREETDTACVTGDERQFESEIEYPSAEQAAMAAENPDVDPVEFGGEVVMLDEGDGVDNADILDEMPTPTVATKATNPKDTAASGKPTYSNVPVPVLYEIGAALLEGARKYGGYNWRMAGVATSVYIDAARRHLDAFWEGEDIDPDSGLSHITKAIAGLVVFRDAMIQGKVDNDNRPPRTQVPFMAGMTNAVQAIIERYPDPVPGFTQAEVGYIRDEPVEVVRGRVTGFDVEVMLPGPPEHPSGYVWAQQGSTRTDLDQALAVAQALREDGYGERVIRVTGIFERVEVTYDGSQYVSGEMREQITTVFPGDPSLTTEVE